MKIDYVTIFTSKVDETITFYTDVMGLELGDRVEMPGDVTLVFLSDGDGVNVELVDMGSEVAFVENSPVALTTIVKSIIDAEEMVDSKGISKSFGPVTTPSGVSLLHIKDPNGVIINFVEMP